jgi:hypothetical protein
MANIRLKTAISQVQTPAETVAASALGGGPTVEIRAQYDVSDPNRSLVWGTRGSYRLWIERKLIASSKN